MTDSNDTNNEENQTEENQTEENQAEETSKQDDQLAAMEAAMAEAAASEAASAAEPEVTAAQSAEQIARTVSSKDVNIDALLKVPVSLSIEVGRTKMALNDLLETQEGAVIELERLLDEPLDILVNGALIAHGVVVLAEDRFGIQITDIISLEERARSL
jgi:flagellar motor switch protein FliN/FliY